MRAEPNRNAQLLRRHLFITLSSVSLYLASMYAIEPDPVARSILHYRVVIILGYGHLIGATAGSLARRRRSGEDADSLARRTSHWLLAIALLFSLYCMALKQLPALVLPLLALATWHTVENEWALHAAYRRDHHLPPLSRDPRVQLATLTLTALVLAIAGGTLEREDIGDLLPLVVLEIATTRPLAPLCFGDVFAASTLFHLVGWLAFLGQRGAAQGPDAWNRTVRLLAWTHLPVVGLCLVLLALPADMLMTLRGAVFSPAIYLFWSMLHVGQTVVSRIRRAGFLSSEVPRHPPRRATLRGVPQSRRFPRV
jgi:energy-converting hydrogenase Eha subunit E